MGGRERAQSAFHFTNERGCITHLSCLVLSYGCLSCAIKKEKQKKNRRERKRLCVLTHRIHQPPRQWRALRAPQAALAFCSKGLAERCVILENSGTSFSEGAARCVQTLQLGSELRLSVPVG